MKVYKSLMITKLNFDYFTQYGIKPETYLDFLSIKNSPLYDVIMNCKVIEKVEDRRSECSKIINYIVDAIYVYLDESDFYNIFHGIPTASIDFLRNYLLLVLNFFKSYKVDFTHVNIIYKMDNRLDNAITVIDRLSFKYLFDKIDKVSIDDFIQLLIHLTPKEMVELTEKMSMDVTYWRPMLFNTDKVDYKEIIKELLLTVSKYDYASPYKDIIAEYVHVLDKADVVSVSETMNNNVYFTVKDEVSISDTMWKHETYI